MPEKKWVRRFSCVHCGTPFEVYPPDMNHTRASLEDPKNEASGTVIKMTYDCKNKNCLKPTTLYWYRQKMTFGVA